MSYTYVCNSSMAVFKFTFNMLTVLCGFFRSATFFGADSDEGGSWPDDLDSSLALESDVLAATSLYAFACEA